MLTITCMHFVSQEEHISRSKVCSDDSNTAVPRVLLSDEAPTEHVDGTILYLL